MIETSVLIIIRTAQEFSSDRHVPTVLQRWSTRQEGATGFMRRDAVAKVLPDSITRSLLTLTMHNTYDRPERNPHPVLCGAHS